MISGYHLVFGKFVSDERTKHKSLPLFRYSTSIESYPDALGDTTEAIATSLAPLIHRSPQTAWRSADHWMLLLQLLWRAIAATAGDLDQESVGKRRHTCFRSKTKPCGHDIVMTLSWCCHDVVILHLLGVGGLWKCHRNWRFAHFFFEHEMQIHETHSNDLWRKFLCLLIAFWLPKVPRSRSAWLDLEGLEELQEKLPALAKLSTMLAGDWPMMWRQYHARNWVDKKIVQFVNYGYVLRVQSC